MSIKNGKDYLLLIWKDPKTRRRYIIGELSRNGYFEFSYGYEVESAIKNGFELLISFPDINKIYKNDDLFSVFGSRLPDPKRKGIEAILAKYGLEEYEAYKLLKRSGARLPIDNLEFIDPIFNLELPIIEREFFVAGPRYYLGCDGENCEKSVGVAKYEEMILMPEPQNEYDEYAIKILNLKGCSLGYVPRYYTQSINDLKLNDKIVCKVIEVNKMAKCNECIKVKITITRGKL